MASTMPKLFHLLILLLVSLLATIFMAARIASQVGASGRVIGRRQLLGGASLVGTTGLIRPMTAAAATPEGLQTAKNGMQWVDVEVGAGDAPVKGAQIKCHYTGRLKSNGQKFDSSYDRRQPLAFTIGVGQVIKGWDVGILGNGDDIPPMRYGGKRLVIIPPELGYGARGAGGVIPPNAVLEFDVELLPRNEATGWLQEQLEKGVAQAKKLTSWLDAV